MYGANNKSPQTEFMKSTKNIAEYFGKTLRQGNKIQTGIETMTTITAGKHSVTEFNDEDPVKKMEQELEIKLWATSKRDIEVQMAKAFNIIIGQCTPALIVRLKGTDSWKAKNEKKDPITLLTSIQNLLFQNTERKYYIEAIVAADQTFHTMYQGEHESDIKFYERFQNQMKVTEEIGAHELGTAPVL